MTCSIGLEIQIKKLQPKLLEEARGKYVVAEFLPFQDVDDITVEAIPGYWLGECATPFIISLPKNIIHTYMFAYIPNDSSHRVRKAKLENCLPDTAKWIKWPLRFVLKTIFDTYQDARKEEANAEAYPYSDLEGYKNVDTTTVGVRRRISKKTWADDTSSAFTCNDDSSVNGDEDSDEETGRFGRDLHVLPFSAPSVALEKGMLPDPPVLIIQPEDSLQSQVNVTNESDMDSMARDLDGDLPSNLPQGSARLTELEVIQSKPDCTLAEVVSAGNITSQANSGIHESASTSKETFMDSTIVGQPSFALPGFPEGLDHQVLDVQDMDLLHFLSDKKPVDDFYKACFFRLLQRTAETENKVVLLEKRIESLIEQQNNPKESEDAINDKERLNMEALVPLPVSTTEGLQLLNETVKTNSRYFTFLRLFMKDACPIPNMPNFDSKTIKQELHKAVGHIYSRIMTNELALQYNLFGQNINPNGPHKQAFKQFKDLLTVTFEAIKPKAQMAKLDLNKAQSDGAVGEWLRQATNRLEEKKN